MFWVQKRTVSLRQFFCLPVQNIRIFTIHPESANKITSSAIHCALTVECLNKLKRLLKALVSRFGLSWYACTEVKTCSSSASPVTCKKIIIQLKRILFQKDNCAIINHLLIQYRIRMKVILLVQFSFMLYLVVGSRSKSGSRLQKRLLEPFSK